MLFMNPSWSFITKFIILQYLLSESLFALIKELQGKANGFMATKK